MLEGLVQHDHPLTLQHILDRMRRLYAESEVVTLTDGGTERASYAEVCERIETLPSLEGAADPEQATVIAEAKDKFRRAFARLSERERELAVLLYVKNLTLREIGEVLGVSESRVCRLHARLKARLREALAADELLFREAV